MSDTFAEFLQRSAIAEWQHMYVDLTAINKRIEEQLSDSGNPAVGAAFETLTARCIDYQLAVRCSFNDGWEFPLPLALAVERKQEKAAAAAAAADKVSAQLKRWLSGRMPTQDGDDILPASPGEASLRSKPAAISYDDDDDPDIGQNTVYSFDEAAAAATIRKNDLRDELRASQPDDRGLKSRLALAVRSVRCLIKVEGEAIPIACTVRWRAVAPAAKPMFSPSNDDDDDNNKNTKIPCSAQQQSKLTSNLLFVMPCTSTDQSVALSGFWVFRLVQNEAGAASSTVSAPSPASPPKRIAAIAMAAMMMQRMKKHNNGAGGAGSTTALAPPPAPAAPAVPPIVQTFTDICTSLTTIQLAYRRLARSLLFEIRKVADFYSRQSEVIASAIASCIDAAKSAKYFSDRSRALFVAASRESFNALDTMQEFCETNVLGLTMAMDSIEQARKQHAVLDSADAICKLPFALTKNSGMQLLRGDLIDAFRRSYLVVRLVDNSALKLDDEEFVPTPAPTPKNDDDKTKEDEHEMTIKGGLLSAVNVPDAEEEKKKKEKDDEAAAKKKRSSGFLKNPISSREARRLLQNSGGSAGGGGGLLGAAGAAAASTAGGGGGAEDDVTSAFDFFWKIPRTSFFLLFGLCLGLLSCAASDLFALLEDPVIYIRHAHNNAWWHFYCLIIVPLMLLMWAACVSVWESIGVNYVFLFRTYWDKWILFRNGTLYLFWWSLCAYAYCNRARYEQREWMLLSAQTNFTMGWAWKNVNVSDGGNVTQQVLRLFDNEAGPTAAAWVIPFLLWPLFGLTFFYFQFVEHGNRRRWFLSTLGRVATTAWNKDVRFADFIVCACLITVGAVWTELQWFWCYLHPTYTENLEHPAEGACLELRAMAIPLLRCVPLGIRSLQCFKNYYAPPAAKRTFFPHALNGIKYIVVMFALLARMFIGISKRTHARASERGLDWLGVNHTSEATLDAAVAVFYIIRIVDGVYRSVWDCYVDFGMGPYKHASVDVVEKVPAPEIKDGEQQDQKEQQRVVAPATAEEDDGGAGGRKRPRALQVSHLTQVVADGAADDEVALAPASGGAGRFKRLMALHRKKSSQEKKVENPPAVVGDASPLSPTIMVEPPSSSSEDDDDEEEQENDHTAAAEQGHVPQKRDSLLVPGAGATSPSAAALSTRGMFAAATAARRFMRLKVDASQRTLGIRPTVDPSDDDEPSSEEDSSPLKQQKPDGDGAVMIEPFSAKTTTAAAVVQPPHDHHHHSPSSKKKSYRYGGHIGPCGWVLRPLLLPRWCYPVFITVDILIRFAWIARYHLAVYGWGPDAPMRRSEAIPFIFIFVVILRRFLWLLVRVEHEQSGNIELYKTTRAAPPLRASNLIALKNQMNDPSQQGAADIGSEQQQQSGGGALGTYWDDASDTLALTNVGVAVAATGKTVAAQFDFAQSAIDKFFALLPNEEKLAICNIAIPLTHRRPPDGYEFTGLEGEGKSAWFASLRAEMKVHAVLRRTGEMTLDEYASSVSSSSSK